MSTGSKYTNFADKRNLAQQRLKDTFFDYLLDLSNELTSRAWGGQRGVFGTATITGGVDVISIGALPVSLLDGNGKVLTVAGSDGLNLAMGENALGVVYYVGARHCVIPEGVDRNPRNAVVNYDLWVDSIGESADPDSLAEAAGQIDIIVDSIFEVGVSHAGRLVTVYLKNPVTTIEATAIERNVAVTWDGVNNRILTTGLLGQSSGSISTVAADYTVVAQGVTIRRNTNLGATSPYAYLGTATGAGGGGVPVTSVAGQIDVTSGISNTLDEAYDNSTPAAKIVLVDDGALDLDSDGTPSVTGDGHNAQLRLRRLLSTDFMQFQLEILIGDDKAIPLAILQTMHRAGGILNLTETVDQVAPDLLDFTRGGALDLTDTDLRLRPSMNVVLLETGPEAGTMYVIRTVNSASQLQLMGLQSGLPPVPWTVGAGLTARILTPKVIFANKGIHQYVGGTTLDDWKGFLFNLREGAGDPSPIRIMPEGAGGIVGSVVEFYNETIAPKVHTSLAGDGLWNFGSPTAPAGFMFVGNPNGDPLRRSHLIYPAPLVVVDGDLPCHRVAAKFNEDQVEIKRWGMWGNEMQVARFREDFATVTQPSRIGHNLNGAGTVSYNGGSNATHGGVAECLTGAVLNNFTGVHGPAMFVLRDTTTPVDRVVYWHGRCRLLTPITTVEVTIGFEATGRVYFLYDPAVNAGKWQINADDGGGGGTVNADTGIAGAGGTVNDDLEWLDFWMKLDIASDTVWYWMTGMAGVAGIAFENVPTGFADLRGRPYFKVLATAGAAARIAQVALLETWDEIIRGGPAG